jgi:MraZ protein
MSSSTWLAGEHRTVLDPEARILLPMGIRNTLNPLREEVTLMSTLEPEGCVGIRRVDQWDGYVRELRGLAGHSQRDRRLMMLVAATSSQVKIDRQGRMRLPDTLLAKAGIERPGERAEKAEVVVTGFFDDLRVWSAERWDTFCERALDDYATDLDGLHGVPSPDGNASALTD